MLPERVEEAQADIMTIFHGMTLERLDAMYVEELMAWRERARIRAEVKKE